MSQELNLEILAVSAGENMNITKKKVQEHKRRKWPSFVELARVARNMGYHYAKQRQII